MAIKCLIDESQFIIDIVVSPNKGTGKVLILVDGDHGINIDDCAEISRKLSKMLDDAGWMNDRYMLEVSTPGIDRPLTTVRQYKRNVGRRLKLKLKEGQSEGLLKEVSENNIVLVQTTGKGKKAEEKTVEVAFSEIEKAFVLISFN